MNPATRELLDGALRLPLQDRAALAAELIDSLESIADDDVRAAWDAEVQRRLNELDRGEVTPIPWPEARKMILGSVDGPTIG